MAPPDAAFSFTIPSIHDDLVLDCRVYHPETFLVGGDSSGPRWKPKGAIVAHPYAPMGGSQYDPVVGAMAKSILTKDTVVGTFNFRSDIYQSPETKDWADMMGTAEAPGHQRDGPAGQPRLNWQTTFHSQASSSITSNRSCHSSTMLRRCQRELPPRTPSLRSPRLHWSHRTAITMHRTRRKKP